jgi:hypothetical protein
MGGVGDTDYIGQYETELKIFLILKIRFSLNSTTLYFGTGFKFPIVFNPFSYIYP